MTLMLMGANSSGGPETTQQTSFGVDLPAGGWPVLFQFEAATGVTTKCARIFGGGGNTTSGAARAATTRSGTSAGLQPGCDIYLSCRFAENPATSDATLISYLQAVQPIAATTLAAGAEFFLSVNPEPERDDRTYTDAEWITMHTRVWTLGQTHAPSVTWIFNTTGYQHDIRIGRYDALAPNTWDMFCIDAYWLQGSTHQADEADALDAHDWLATNHPTKRFGMGEWGVQQGSEQAADLAQAVAFQAAFTNPHMEISPYFEDVGPWDTRLLGTGNEDVYGTAVDAL